jgi:beta-aspartyl-peptidase (threonine type)
MDFKTKFTLGLMGIIGLAILLGPNETQSNFAIAIHGGAGTYANNQTCAVSGTGQGEYFIRGNVAHDISAIMEYENVSVGKAARKVIGKLSERGGEGGVIAMDSNGIISMPFNTAGMYRGFRIAGSLAKIFIYKN